jgi:carbon-monoxide dehydrogenase medium subunit
MIPAAFEYFAPRNLKEALQLLNQYGEEGKLLAGGQSLLPLMKLRLGRPKVVIDLNRIPGLAKIRQTGGEFHLGSMTRHSAVEESKLLGKSLRILVETARGIGDPQVRNMGTIGGSLAHADPAADYPTVASALRARLHLQSASGERWIGAEEFFLDMMTTALEPNEMITEVLFPKLPPGTGAAYVKLERKAGDFATVGVAAIVTLDGGSICKSASVFVGAVGPKPIHAREAGEKLAGKQLTDELVDQSAESAALAADPETDLRGTREYKRAVTRVYAAKAIKEAGRRAGGKL